VQRSGRQSVDLRVDFRIGTYNGSQISFTPSATGSYQFILKATDACGATDYDTAIINVTLNVGRSARCRTIRPSSSARRRRSACRVGDRRQRNSLVPDYERPGIAGGGSWCYTPTSTQTVTVTVRCEDSCNAYCESTSRSRSASTVAPSIALGNDTTSSSATRLRSACRTRWRMSRQRDAGAVWFPAAGRSTRR